MTLKNNLLGTAAAIAVSTAFGVAVVHAQATADTGLGAGQTMTLVGDVDIDNVQLKSANATSTVSGSTFAIDSIGVTTDTVSAALSLTDNIFPPSATGNTSSSSVILAFAPTTAGDTAVVGNLQSVETDTISATASDDTHRILVETPGAPDVRTFSGSALLDNNDTTASATGNSGTSEIDVAAGLDVIQEAPGQASAGIDATLAAVTDHDVSGDLVVSSSQEVDGANSSVPTPTINITGTVSNANTTATIEDLQGGTVTVSGSDQASTATGNAASNSIISDDTTASITGSAVVSNLQTIDPDETVDITARTVDSTIGAFGGFESDGSITGDVDDSTMTVSGNTQTADATGNDSAQTITLDAANITGEGVAATSNDSNPAPATGVQLLASGDAVIANVQREDFGTTVTGTVNNNTIIASAQDAGSGAADRSTIEVDDNSQTASATGSRTSNALSLTSGATQSAAGVVASVQNGNASVLANATGNTITAEIAEDGGLTTDVDDGSLLTTNNSIGSTATGGDATNDLSVTNGTNNLSAETNSGTTLVNILGGAEQPDVVAAQVVTNDQSRAGLIEATTTGNQVTSFVDDDVDFGTVRTDGNSMSSSATGQTADNGIDLAFNSLTGGIATNVGAVASVANEQDMLDGSTVTARTVGTDGEPILTDIGGNVDDSSVSTSDNTVSATARGNVTTGNDVVAAGTNITSGSPSSPVISATTGAVSAGGSFISASSQVSGADILATQNDSELAPTTSNTIETGIGDDLTDSTLVSDGNLLSSSATANTAANSVALGGATSAAVDASGTLANYQGTTAQGSVTAILGIEGTDPTPGTPGQTFTSLSGAFDGTDVGNDNTLGLVGTDLVVGAGDTVTIDTSALGLSPAEEAALQNELLNIGFNQSGSVFFVPVAGTYDLSSFTGANFDNVSDDIGFTGLNLPGTPATPGTFNGAGVIARIDADNDGSGEILRSTVSVSDNTVVGEATGNTATNVVSAEATDVTGPLVDASLNPSNADVDVTGAELANGNVQVNESALQTDVAATFAIIDDGDEIDAITDSSQTLDGNLQQSFATANRVTNSVDVTATNTDAATALESSQVSAATVNTTSDIQVVGIAGGTNSSLDMTGNRNESVANGNVATNSVDIAATNLDGAGTDASVAVGTVTAENVLSSVQSVTASISADADTDVFNQDETATGNPVVSGSVEQSGNVTIAQATGNQTTPTTNSLTLGNADTANNDRSGALTNVQSVTGTGTVEATVDQSVRVELDQTATIPVDQSSIVQDGNVTSALARSNVATNSVTVDGANIDAGGGSDANFSEGTGITTAAHALASSQTNQFDVTATTTQSQVRLSSINSDGNAIDASSVSQSGNSSLATALANSAVNSVSSGANAANVDATTALGNVQNNFGAIEANGSSSVGVVADANGASDPSGINLSSVDVSGNVSSSSAVGNQAQNSLSASGANINSGDPSVQGNASSPALGTGNATVDNSGADALANAGNLLLSYQANTGTITSTNNANNVSIDASAADGTGAAASGSTLSVGGNAVEARAMANLALNNSVNVGDMSTASTGATGIVGNFQFNDTTGAVTAQASTTTSITLNGVAGAGALSNGTADVSGNSVLALARGNVSQNVLNAEGSNVGTGSANATTSSVGAPDSGILNASFGVFNEQVQQASVDASSTGASFRVNATSGTGQALNGASASLSGNSVQASGFGNVATNSLTLTALNGTPGNDATAAIFNGQSNSGNITSTVTGASIGTFSTGGVSNASASVGGNSIGATSVGNFSSSTVTRSNR